MKYLSLFLLSLLLLVTQIKSQHDLNLLKRKHFVLPGRHERKIYIYIEETYSTMTRMVSRKATDRYTGPAKKM